MNDPLAVDGLGLRDSDLSSAERAAVAQRVATDPEAAADQAFAAELTALLPASVEGGPPLSALRPRRRWQAPAVGVALAMAAAALFVVMPSDGPLRDRGTSAAVAPVALTAVAEGPHGTRRLADGDPVRPGERVVFWVDTAVPGDLVLYEDGRAIVGDWAVGAGAHAVGGTTPQSWRPDAGRGPMTYRVERCGPPCADATLRLVWE